MVSRRTALFVIVFCTVLSGLNIATYHRPIYPLAVWLAGAVLCGIVCAVMQAVRRRKAKADTFTVADIVNATRKLEQPRKPSP